MTVISPPVRPPAAAKHATVPIVGVLPGVLTITSGSSSPVTFPIAAENLYLAFWYIENDIVRTAVTLTRGAREPMWKGWRKN